jgi:hypothetical protein
MAAIDPKVAEEISGRAAALCRWLCEVAPYAAADQRHLDEGTPERAYWHSGYLAALADVLKMAGVAPMSAHGSEDMSS